MSLPVTRAVARRSQWLLSRQTIRAQSTTSQTAETVKSKASEGLTRVTSSAGPAISGAAAKASNALGRVGGRTGRLIGFVQSLIPPTIYYSRVGLELSKMVFRGQNMSPPSIATFQSYLQPVIRNPVSTLRSATSEASSFSPRKVLNNIRNIDSAQLAAVGVLVAEVIGFFTVGEMLGRFKIVGYRGEVHHH